MKQRLRHGSGDRVHRIEGMTWPMATTHACLLAGLLAGFSIATSIGPMGALCIQRTLTSGMRVGVSTGLGAATATALCGALVILGLDATGPLMVSGGRVLSFAGGLFLLWSAANMPMRRRISNRQHSPAALSPLAAYRSAVAFNAANPMLPVRIIALLSPVVRLSAPSLAGATVLLFGMFMAAATWWVCLSGGVTLLRSRLSPGMLLAVNQAAGVILALYGALALARSAGT